MVWSPSFSLFSVETQDLNIPEGISNGYPEKSSLHCWPAWCHCSKTAGKLLLELLENHKIMEFKSTQEVSSSAFSSKQGQIQTWLRLLRAFLLDFGG